MYDNQNKQLLLGQLEAAGAVIRADGREIKCPFHDDQHASGGVYQGDDGAWRYKCHAGSCGFCGDVFDVMARAENRPLEDVLKEHSGKPDSSRRAPVKAEPKVYANIEAIEAIVPGQLEARYTYTNPEHRKPDLVVLRYRANNKKSFWQVSAHRGGWAVRRPAGLLPLYNRIEVAAAKSVVVVEGEKCVHAMRACGHVSTTSPMGAGKAAYADWSPLAGKVVHLWPDNDEAGIRHMQDVADILSHLEPAAAVYWIDPKGLHLPAKGDVADFIAGMDCGKAHSAVAAVLDSAIPMGAASELRELLENTISGKRTAVSWPWESVTLLTRALLPGTVTLFCGEPGGAKSFAILQSLRHWHEAGVKAVVFELEEDRAYHLNRLLAQECMSSDLLDPDWIKEHPDSTREAIDRHMGLVNEIGRRIYAAPKEQVDYKTLATWTEARAVEGARVIVIDPVTAVSPTRDVWVADSEFIFQVKTIAREYKCSIVLVTHPRKGRGSTCSMDDLAGGAAFQRFAQTLLWLESMKHVKTYTTRSACGCWPMECNRILHLMKCRNGRGTGMAVGMMWQNQSLALIDHGVIVDDRKKNSEPAAMREPGEGE